MEVSCEMPRTAEKAIVGTYGCPRPEHDRRSDPWVGVRDEDRLLALPHQGGPEGEQVLHRELPRGEGARQANIIGDTKVQVKGNEVIAHRRGPGIRSRRPRRTSKGPPSIKGFDPRVFQDGIYITEKARRAK